MRSLNFLGVIALLVIGAGNASAREELSKPDPDRWWFEIAPYIWATAVESDAEIGSVSAEAEYDFGDILDNLNGALMLHAEAHHGNWTIFTDVFYADIESEDSFGPMGGGEIDVELTQLILELGGAYTVGGDRVHLDILAGARALYLDPDIDISIGMGSSSFGDDEWYLGPLVGARLRFDLNSRWWLSVRGDVSGFGIDDATMWNVTGLVGYRFTKMFSMAAGYRYMDIELEDSNLDLELAFQGPIIGFGFRF